MALVITPRGGGGYIYSNSDWTEADVAFFTASENADGSEWSYNKKQAYFVWANAMRLGQFDVIAGANGDELSSLLLAGINVSTINYDAVTYNRDYFTKDINSAILTLNGAPDFTVGKRVTITSVAVPASQDVTTETYSPLPITITEEMAGPTLTINEALQSYWVGRNGFVEQNVTFDVDTHTWTFDTPLVEGDVITVGYKRYA